MKALRTRFAAALRSLASRMETSRALVAPPAEDPGPGEQAAFAKKFCDDLKLREALFRALTRFSPTRETAQA